MGALFNITFFDELITSNHHVACSPQVSIKLQAKNNEMNEQKIFHVWTIQL